MFESMIFQLSRGMVGYVMLDRSLQVFFATTKKYESLEDVF